MGLHKGRIRADTRGFEVRLFLTLLLTLIVVGALQYAVTSKETKERLLNEATFRAKGDVVFIQEAFQSSQDNDTRIKEMNERLTTIAARTGIRYVFLVDRYGVIVASSNPELIGNVGAFDQVGKVVAVGKPHVELSNYEGARTFRYTIPVELPTGQFALQVEQNASVIEDQLSSLRKSTLIMIGFGIAVGCIFFFLFGGGSLAAMHRQALRLSNKDGLTNLENHRSFQEALARSVAVAARQQSPLSLALIDVDDFKLVNDRLGHRQGDQLLKKAAALLDTGRVADRAFRIGGDEFALILAGTNSDGAWIVCERLWKTISSELDGVTISVGVASLEGATIGTSTPTREATEMRSVRSGSAEGMDHADLYEHADVALYEAKRRGRNAVVSFEELGGAAVIPAEKVRSVRRLLEDQHLGTAFQPIWDLEGERPLGFEALARPPANYALNGPGELFQIGEMIGRTQELDVLSWKCALSRASELPKDVLLFMNVSPFTADHGDAPIDKLHEAVQQSALPPNQIVVEFTEKWSGRRDLVIEQAERLRSFGFKLALDDVGAGSGDLEMMARLPVDFIKIDLNIVQRARTDSTARGVLFAIAAFAIHAQSLVIAEGIEDERTLNFIRGSEFDALTRIAVRGGQGYFLGMPTEGPPVVQPAPYSPSSPPNALVERKVEGP